MIQGQNLDALFANLMEENVELNATEEAQVMSYVMLSRAKFLDKVSKHIFLMSMIADFVSMTKHGFC